MPSSASTSATTSSPNCQPACSASRNPVCPSWSARGRNRPARLHDQLRVRDPRSRRHLPRGRHASDHGRRRGPAQHPGGDPVDRRVPQRVDPDHRQQEHVADRDRRDDRGDPGERPGGAPAAPADRLQPGVPAPGTGRRGLLQPGPDRRRVALCGGCARGRRPVRRASGRGDHHRPADGRDDQVRRQLVPRHEDLVHQRDRPPVRADRRRHRPGRRGDRPRPADRRPLLPARDRVRRELPAQGRRRAALHRRDVRRRDAGPVRASRRSTRAQRTNAVRRLQSHGSASSRAADRRLGPDLQGRHRGHARVAGDGRRRACSRTRAR